MECDQFAHSPDLDQVLEVERHVHVAAVAIGGELQIPASRARRNDAASSVSRPPPPESEVDPVAGAEAGFHERRRTIVEQPLKARDGVRHGLAPGASTCSQ